MVNLSGKWQLIHRIKFIELIQDFAEIIGSRTAFFLGTAAEVQNVNILDWLRGVLIGWRWLLLSYYWPLALNTIHPKLMHQQKQVSHSFAWSIHNHICSCEYFLAILCPHELEFQLANGFSWPARMQQHETSIHWRSFHKQCLETGFLARAKHRLQQQSPLRPNWKGIAVLLGSVWGMLPHWPIGAFDISCIYLSTVAWSSALRLFKQFSSDNFPFQRVHGLGWPP